MATRESERPAFTSPHPTIAKHRYAARAVVPFFAANVGRNEPGELEEALGYAEAR